MRKPQIKQDMAARAAWMYYISGKTQHEIAELLGASRQVIQRLVASAAEEHIVSFQINHPVAECTKLAAALAKKFDLQFCRVVPSAKMDTTQCHQMIAAAGSEVIAHYLSQPEPLIIALGSGKTLRNAIELTPNFSRPYDSYVSLIGAIASDGSSTRYDVPLWMAEKTQGKYFILPAPLFADSGSDRQTWCQHRIYKMVTEKASHADVTFIGIADVRQDCPLYEHGFITSAEVDELLAEDAVAEIIGHFLNRHGELLSNRLHDRLTSVRIRPSPTRPVIAFAGGKNKHQAIASALRGKWINGLVTDEEAARAILFSREHLLDSRAVTHGSPYGRV